MPPFFKNIALWIVIAMVLMSVFNSFSPQGTNGSNEVDYSTFLAQVSSSNVESVVITDDQISGVTKDGQKFTTLSPGDPELVNQLYKYGVSIKAEREEGPGILMTILVNWFPFLLLIGVWIYIMRQMQGGGGKGAMSFGKSKAQLLPEDKNTITFDDVAGIEEAKEEVADIVEFLRDPSKFHKLGGRMPRGSVDDGQPGYG